MRYLSYALYPLVIGYAIYALVYESHKSWYSWILNSLVGAVYTFGFILMCPQVPVFLCSDLQIRTYFEQPHISWWARTAPSASSSCAPRCCLFTCRPVRNVKS